MRKAYSAPCKFHADEVTPANRIYWYQVPDDRQIYDGLTVFWPRVDVDKKEAGGPFEQCGAGGPLRMKEPGFDYYGFPGTHVHGDEQDFLGKSPLSKHFDGTSWVTFECGGPRLQRVGILFGGAFPPITEQEITLAAKVRFGARHFSVVEFAKVRLKGTSIETNIHKAGLKLDAAQLDLVEKPETIAAAIRLDAAQLDLIEKPETVAAAIRLDAAQLDLVEKPETVAAAVELNAFVSDVITPPETIAAAIALGAASEDASPPPPETPGSTCETALLIPPGPHTFDIAAGELHWIKILPGPIGPNRVMFQNNSGAVSAFDFYSGSDCGSLTYYGNAPFFPFCSNLGGISDPYLFKITASAFSGANYTIEWQPGPCP